MTMVAESMFQQLGFQKDASGNYNPPPVPTEAAPAAAAPAAAPVARAPTVPAKAVAPVKATSPEVDIPEPPIGGSVAAVDPAAATKKKTLLGA